MINIFQRQDEVGVDIVLLEKTCQKMLECLGYSDFDVSITLCDADFIQDLNNRYRDKDQPTDILSFPMFDLKPGEKPVVEDGMPQDLGDLIIYPARVVVDAQELGVEFSERMKKLLAHGLCHLLGYTHYTEEDDDLMKPLEEKLMEC